MADLPKLRSLLASDLLAMINDSKEVPLVCLFSLLPIHKWIRDGDAVVRFSCPVECKSNHAPVKVVLPVYYGNSWSEIQTFTMPEESIVRLVERTVGKLQMTVTEELPYRDRVAYYAREMRAVRGTQNLWV